MDNKNFIEQQVKEKIKDYNRQRIGIGILIVIIMAVLLLFPALGNEALSIRFAVLCSALFISFSLLFVLSGKSTTLLFLAATTIVAVLLVYKQIHLELSLIHI